MICNPELLINMDSYSLVPRGLGTRLA